MGRFVDMVMATRNEVLYLLRAHAPDSGLPACYYVLLKKEKAPLFKHAVEHKESLNIYDFGAKIIGSCYGEEPTEALKEKAREKGWPV